MSGNRKCQVLVVGAGPGGYVAAIRAAQLGLDTIIVEGEKAGGVCLNVGCIPSKAIIHAAERYEALRKHSSEGGHMGISLNESPELQMNGIVEWKDGIVQRLTKGVETLLKNAGAELINGWATFSSSKLCTVKTDEGEISIEAENVIIATGSTHIDLSLIHI